MLFTREVQLALAFLVNDLGFVDDDEKESAIGQMAVFRKPPLALEVGWYKGEVRAAFVLDLAFTAEHPVFRPYRSRTFDLGEIIRLRDPAAYRTVPEALRNQPVFVTRDEQLPVVLSVMAQQLRQYAADVLAGDFRMLEELTRVRYPEGSPAH